MKISISKKIILLAVVPSILIILISSVGSSILMGSSTLDEIEKQLKLAVYSIEHSTQQMNEENTKVEVVDELINDFRNQNNIDITIFDYDTRVFSTVPNAVGTKMDSVIWGKVRDGNTYFSKNANVNGTKYYAYYAPVMLDGECVGAFFAGEPASRVDGMIIRNMLNMALMTMVCGVLTIILSIVIASKITKRIDKLKDVLTTLNENDLTKNYDKYGVAHDEIEELNNETIDFSEHLKQIINSIKSTSNDLKTIASDLNINVQHTNETCNQISQAVESVASGAISQAEDTSNAAQNINDMSIKLEQIKANTTDLHNIADSMNNAKNNTLVTLSELQKVNGVMMNEITSADVQVKATSESVEQIKKALEMIQDITDQTKLLSLNASIEAAHAGEHGKGFSVVAEEIGKLANQSAHSSNEIEEILGRLVKDYDVIIESVNRTSGNMTIQNEKLTDTQNTFCVLENDINGTIERIESINSMVENINDEIGKMVDMVSNLSAISEENSASTQETMASIEELTAIIGQVSVKAQNVDEGADELMKEINVFKTQ